MTPEEKIERYKEIERRGLLSQLPPEKQEAWAELKRRRGIDVEAAQPMQQQPQPEPQVDVAQEPVADTSGSSPRMRRANQVREQRQEGEQAMMDTIRQNVPLYSGDLESLDEIGGAPELNEMSMRALKASAAANLIGSDFELAQAIKAQVPEATFTRDEDMNLIATMPSGGSYYLNAPGFSGQDLMKLGTRFAAFTPAGRGITGGGAAALLGAGAQSAGIEAGLQGIEAGVGGEFDAEQVGMAAAGGAAGQKLGSSIGGALERRAVEKATRQAAPSAEALKAQARTLYQQIDDLGAKLPQEQTSAFSKSVESMLKREGYNAKINPEIAGVLDELGKFGQAPATLSQADTLRKVAQNAAGSQNPSTSRLGSMVIEKIDDMLERVPPQGAGGAQAGQLYKQARQLWGQARKSEMLAQAFEKAKNQASGFENGLRVQFRSILNNPKKMRGFTAEEKRAIATVVRGGSAENMLKALGKFGFTEGQATNMLLGTIGIGAGAAVAGPGGAAVVPIVGQTARVAAQKLTKANAMLADDIVRAGRNGRDIVRAYLKSVPKSERSVEELTGLLLENKAVTTGLQEFSDPLIRDAALGAALVSYAAPMVNDGDEGEAENQ